MSAFASVIFGSGPAAAHGRQLKGLGLYAEDLSRLVRRSLGARLLDSNYAGAKEGGTQ